MSILKVYAVHRDDVEFSEDEELFSQELGDDPVSTRMKLTASIVDAEMAYDVYLDNVSVANGTTEAFGTSGGVGFYINREAAPL